MNQAEIDREITQKNGEATPSNLNIQVLDKQGSPKSSFASGSTLVVSVKWSNLDNLESIGVNVMKESGEHITGFNSRFMPNETDWRKRKQLNLRLELNVRPGKYYLLVEAFKNEGVVIDSVLRGPHFSVVAPANQKLTWSGLTKLPHEWI